MTTTREKPARLPACDCLLRLLTLLPWLVCAHSLRAEFAPPRLVTDGEGKSTQTAMGLDAANNAYISSVVDERIRVKVIGPDLELDVPIAALGLGQGDPDFATNALGTTFLVFSQLDSPSSEGREVYLSHNGGGQFSEPLSVTRNRVDDYAPRVALDTNGDPHIAWAQRVGETFRVMYASVLLDQATEPLFVALGDYPQIYVDEQGIAHLAYSRGNDIVYNSNKGGSWQNEKRVTTTPFEPESSVSIGGDRGGNIIVSYESRNSLYFAVKSPNADFKPPKLIDTGGILNPRMRVRDRGQLTIVYAKRGDIFFVQGQSTFLDRPQQLTNTSEVESYPSLEIDASGNLHVSYLRDGEVYYTNNAASPVAEFAALPTRGEAPLEVSFGDLSSGGIQVWEWDFGDGEKSTESSPTHLYAQPGPYTVGLRVVAPGAVESHLVKEDFIFVQDPFNTLRIPDQAVIPGQKDVWFPVLASHKEPIAAFQLLGTFDPNFLKFNRFELNFTAIQPLEPEFLEAHDKGTFFEVGCAFEFDPPIEPEQQYLPSGQNRTLINLVFDVSEDAPQGAQTEIELVNDKSLSPVFNIFTINRFTRLPALTGSRVEVLLGPPFPKFFLRGDADGNREVDITDAIRILNYLFTGGTPPVCMDAADVNDRGSVDISGAIAILGYLFLGAASPSVPFPLPGPDPTEDDLGCGAP